MIEKNVHQIWVGKANPIPKKIMQSWVNYCENFGWKYHLWTEDEIDKINLKNNSIYKYYKSRGDVHGMADVARIEIVNQFGGLYCDADFFSWQTNIEKIIPLNHDMFIGCVEHLYPKKSQLHMKYDDFEGLADSAFHLANGFFIAPKDNNILSFMLEQMQSSFSNNEKYTKDFFIDCEGNRRIFGSCDILGCFLLSHCAKKYPFMLIPPKFMFSKVEDVTKNFHKDFKNNIICSYIADYDEKIVEGLL